MVGGSCAGKSNAKPDCDAWAKGGECTGTYAAYMSLNCDLSCCQAAGPPAPPAPASAASPAPVSGKRCLAKQVNIKPLDVIRINPSTKDGTYDQCEALCEGNQECAGFVYQNHHRRIECWLYKSFNGNQEVGENEKKSFTECTLVPENPCLGRGNMAAPWGHGSEKCAELLTNFGADEKSRYYVAGKHMLNECNLAVCEMRNNLAFTTDPTLEMMVGGSCAGKSNAKPDCDAWAKGGECTGTYAAYMSLNCDLSCCQAAGPPAPPAPASAASPAPVSGKRCLAKQVNIKPLDVIRINPSTKDGTYDQCEALCEGNQECAGFVYQNHHRRIECWLYKSFNGNQEVGENEKKSFTECTLVPENPCLGRGNMAAPWGHGSEKCAELLTNFGADEKSRYYVAGKHMLNECNLACCQMRNNLAFTTTASKEAEVAEFDRLETVNKALRTALESLVN